MTLPVFKELLDKFHPHELEERALPLSQETRAFVRDATYFIAHHILQETAQ